MAYNSQIDECLKILNMATALGIWYVQIPNNFVVDPFGVVVEPKVYKGNRVILRNRKQVSVSKLPKLNYQATMDFKEVFVG